jgi:TonB family protein
VKIAITFLAQILIFLSTASATPSPVPFAEVPQYMGKWWKDSEVVRKLQISAEQVQKIEQTFLDYRPSLANSVSELKSGEAKLKTLMSANPVDDARVLNQTELIAVSRASLEKTNSAMMLAIRKILRKEQWDRLQEIRELRQTAVVLSAGKSTALPQSASRAEEQSSESQEQVFHVGGRVKAPKVLYQPLPAYTREAREAKVEGIVLLQGIVRKNGRITDLKVLRGIGFGLDQNAVSTISNEWRFEPGTLDGAPVDVHVNLEISFRRY